MKWCPRHRRFKKRKQLSNPESGQGAVEYILITLITVVIILGLVYQFNAKFKAFAQNYFGNYIACLLETGDLPGVSASGCSDLYPTVSDQQGKGLIAFANNGGSSGSSSSSNSKASSSSSSGNSAHGEALSSNSGQTSNFNSSGGGSGREREANANGAASKKDADAAGYSSLYGSNGAYDRGVANAQSQGDKKYYMGSSDDEGEDKAKAPVTKTGKKTANNGALKPKRVSQDAVRKIASTVDVAESDFTFGAFIRWMIIGALILIIVIFFGGQLMQIMRSREKGGGD